MLLGVKIRKKVEEGFLIAEKYYGQTIPRPKISFDLKGRTAGTSNYSKNELRFNLMLAMENEEQFLGDTVFHEVAHYIQRWKHGYGCPPHGNEWKAIMIQCFKLPPKRCHTYDVTNVSRRTRPYSYKCNCKTYQVGLTLHSRIQRNNPQYICRLCGVMIALQSTKLPVNKGFVITPEELD